MLKSSVMAMTLAAALLGGVSMAVAADAASTNFIKEAIQGNLAEVKMGQLAQQKGQSDEAKKFGQMLQKDHSDANTKAMAVAKQIGVTPPMEPNAEQKAMYDKLSKLSGLEFDRQFAKEMVEDHQKDIAAFQKESSMNDEAGKFAKDTLPTLQHHLQMAQSLDKNAAGTAPVTTGQGMPKGK
jgi:putative membrane protein